MFSTDQEFITVWNASTCVDDVVDEFGYENADTARHRATRLRKRGHYLKNMRHDFDVGPMVKVAEGDYEIGPKEFIIIWQNSESAQEASRIMGLGYDAVRARAREYRKMGIPIKSFKRGRKPNEDTSPSTN